MIVNNYDIRRGNRRNPDHEKLLDIYNQCLNGVQTWLQLKLYWTWYYSDTHRTLTDQNQVFTGYEFRTDTLRVQ